MKILLVVFEKKPHMGQFIFLYHFLMFDWLRL